MSETVHAIAVDLGASSVRFAHGQFNDGRIAFRVIDQCPHTPQEVGGRHFWNWDVLLGECHKAVAYAEANVPVATLGIDTWGVDNGFLGEDGKLLQPPVCYRDPSHQRKFDEMESHRHDLFRWTGIQHQPFNTIYQLAARIEEDPTLPKRAKHWLILPDLLLSQLGGDRQYEATQASTTQLLGLDGKWKRECYELIGWPMPLSEPVSPGSVAGKASDKVTLVRVGSHDTASAVCGFGTLESDQAYLILGSWSILGCITPTPITHSESERYNFSNELGADGRIRFLKNIPGFYVINRIHEELGETRSVGEWLSNADQSVLDRIDLFAPTLFNPESMLRAVRNLIHNDPQNSASWAGVALMGLANCIAEQLKLLSAVTGTSFGSLRVGGGGSKSDTLLQALADTCAVPVLAGPEEATLLGNIGVQLIGAGKVEGFDHLGRIILESIEIRSFYPRV